MWRLTIELDYDEEAGSANADRLVDTIRHWEHDCPVPGWEDGNCCGYDDTECVSKQKAVDYEGNVIWEITDHEDHSQTLVVRTDILDSLYRIIPEALMRTLLRKLHLEEEVGARPEQDRSLTKERVTLHEVSLVTDPPHPDWTVREL